ncbi:MAG: SAM-dependent methyltransferase [Pseudomonadota bacterium]
MNEDFLDAHKRHWDDAELLFQAQRWANADHLYGMAAECGLKALMEKLSPQGALDPKQDYVHIMEDKKPNNAWSRYQSYLSGSRAIMLSLPQTNPFSDWLASQRYAHQANFDQARAQSHRAGAKDVCERIKIAQLGGLL